MAVEEKDLLLKEYELKIRYLSDHLQRMWTRFNFFITIESALIGGKFLVSSNVPSQELAVVGIIVSVLWYVMGAQDRYLFKLYRWQVKKAAARIAATVWNEDQAQKYEYVGKVDDDSVREFVDHEKQQLGRLGLAIETVSSWRSKYFSTTHLAAFYPLIAVALWVFMFFMSKPSP